MKRPFRGATLFIAAAVALTLAISALTTSGIASAAGPTTVNLGPAGAFAILAGTPAITNTGASTVQGDVGIHPAAAVTGFPPGIVAGVIHAGDNPALIGKNYLGSAYDDAAGRPVTSLVAAGALSGTLVGGVYNSGGFTLSIAGTVTLDAQNDPSSVWIFQATSDLVTASSSTVAFINGARPCNVFWQVTSSASLGSGSTFVGTILAMTSITMANGVTLNGRALARNGQVTLINDTITSPGCAVAAAATPAPTATPTASPSPSPTATVAPSAAPTAAPTATPTGTTATIVPAVAGLPSTTTIEDDNTFVILALVVMMFVILYMVARARRRARQPAV